MGIQEDFYWFALDATVADDMDWVSAGEAGGLRLVISAISEYDSVLLINTGSASWYYNNDNGNLDPKIRLTRPANGRIDVWMGTYDGEYCNARLRLETFAR